MTEPYLAISAVVLPRDANPHPSAAGGAYSTVFGGVILNHIDLAGALGARRAVMVAGGITAALIVTPCHQPRRVQEAGAGRRRGQVVRDPVRHGRTSITMSVHVTAERGGETIPVTEAELVYVGVDPSRPDRPPTALGLPVTESAA